MSEPSDLAAGSRVGSSQGREGMDAGSCARAGAGPSSAKSGAASDSTTPSIAADGPAIFGTLNSILPALLPTSTHFKFDAFCLSGRSDFPRTVEAAQPAPRGIRSAFLPVGLRADEAYLMLDI